MGASMQAVPVATVTPVPTGVPFTLNKASRIPRRVRIAVAILAITPLCRRPLDQLRLGVPDAARQAGSANGLPKARNGVGHM